MNAHRLWAGVAMILAATGLQTVTGGSWSLALLVALGVLLVLVSLGDRSVAR